MRLKKNLRPIVVPFLIVLTIILGVVIPYFSSFMALKPAKYVERHVNPSAEASRLPLPSLLSLLVLKPFASMLEGNFSEVPMDLKALELAYVPSGLRFIVDRFIRLMNDVAGQLDGADKLMDGAEALIGSGRGLEAKPVLTEASMKIAMANVTYRELRSASEELAKSFRLPGGDIYARLDDLGHLIELMYHRLLYLLNEAERQTTLIETILSINVEPKTVWTGGVINVEGTLLMLESTASGVEFMPLSERSVMILVDGSKMAEASTAQDGSFQIQLKLPYIYKPTITVRAKYMPMDADSETYKPSISDPVEVNLLYVSPKIMVEPVHRALPGKEFTLKGFVMSNFPLPYSSVRVSWVNRIVDVDLMHDGSFEAILHVPGGLPDGIYALKVNTPASGIFAPASSTLNVPVKRLPVNVMLDAPSIVFAGSSVALEGAFWSGEEGFSASVKVYFAGQEHSVISNGSFSILLNVPLTLLSGYQKCEVLISPSDPWYSEVALERRILVVNPVTLILPTAFLAALVLKAFGGRRSAEATLEEKPKETPKELLKFYFTAKNWRWLIDIYWEAVKVVSDMTGVVMEPYMTMKEFLAATAPKLGKSHPHFEALTLAAERALYSPSVPDWAVSTANFALKSLKAEYERRKNQL